MERSKTKNQNIQTNHETATTNDALAEFTASIGGFSMGVG
jgi:hypothetical protein